MSSHVSATTRDGGGRLASGAEHSTSHKPTSAATASNGGSRFAPCRFAAAAQRGDLAVTGGTALGAPLAAVTAASGTTLASGARTAELARELMASARTLDGEARQVRGGIRRIERLAVEERLDAARRRLRDLCGRHTEPL